MSVSRKSGREAVMERTFDAPRARVFAALTRPERLQRWLTAGRRSLAVCEVDLRAGGSFRYVFRGAGGPDFAMHGEFREVVAGERIVHTESYDGGDWDPLVVTTVLGGEGERTTLTVTIRYPSEEICDADFPNLEHAAAVYDRLAELLAS